MCPKRGAVEGDRTTVMDGYQTLCPVQSKDLQTVSVHAHATSYNATQELLFCNLKQIVVACIYLLFVIFTFNYLTKPVSLLGFSLRI